LVFGFPAATTSMGSLSDKIAKAREIHQSNGVRGVLELTRGFVRTRFGMQAVSKRRQAKLLNGGMHLPRHLTGAVRMEDVLAADWAVPREFGSAAVTAEAPRVHWVIPTANAGSGGHQNIFRFVSHLESRGMQCHLYIQDTHKHRSREAHERIIRDHFVPMNAPVELLDGPMAPADAIFATSWPTAYPVYNDPSEAYRFYFVQDFEPMFYPVGSEYIFAENTYRFGFHGITAGAWLAEKLRAEYGMRCDHYDFGADESRYSVTNTAERNAILFYARPPTPRRAWELGVLTLSLFAEQHPEIEIHMAGWPLRGFKTGFKYTDHGVLRLDELNGLYNQLSAALVLSLTNCSLLPLELLAAGCIPVMNDAPNNRMVVDNPHVRYCPPSPHELARALGEVCRGEDQLTRARLAASSVSDNDWATACNRVEHAILGALRG
jgi:hypothetical protein